MILDFSSLVTLSLSDLVISGVFAFLAGMGGVTVYLRVRSILTDHHHRASEAVTEAVVLEYTRRLRDYDRVIAELRTRIEIMEVRPQGSQAMTSQHPHISHEPQPHVVVGSEPVAVTQHATGENE